MSEIRTSSDFGTLGSVKFLALLVPNPKSELVSLEIICKTIQTSVQMTAFGLKAQKVV